MKALRGTQRAEIIIPDGDDGPSTRVSGRRESVVFSNSPSRGPSEPAAPKMRERSDSRVSYHLRFWPHRRVYGGSRKESGAADVGIVVELATPKDMGADLHVPSSTYVDIHFQRP
jgi:hypothetical protein